MSLQLNAVIIDDEPTMAEYLKDVLVSQGFVAFVATTGAKGFALVEKIKPELVLLDIELPDIDGRSLCQKIKSDYLETKVIMITGHGTSSDIAEGLNLGADDYLPKPIDEGELIARIKARLRKSDYVQHFLKAGDLAMNTKTHEVTQAGRDITLSPQEYTLLHYLLVNKNKVITRNMILSRIWDGNPDIETRIVDVYLGYLRKKIDQDPKRPKLLQTVRGFGYMLKDPVIKPAPAPK
jgi:DNA-binding response OmpR family regulator